MDVASQDDDIEIDVRRQFERVEFEMQFGQAQQFHKSAFSQKSLPAFEN